MKLFPVRTQALRLPALVLVCLLLVLGAVLGFAVCRAVPQQDRQELSDYLHQYAQATADGRGPSASALSVAAAAGICSELFHCLLHSVHDGRRLRPGSRRIIQINHIQSGPCFMPRTRIPAPRRICADRSGSDQTTTL